MTDVEQLREQVRILREQLAKNVQTFEAVTARYAKHRDKANLGVSTGLNAICQSALEKTQKVLAETGPV